MSFPLSLCVFASCAFLQQDTIQSFDTDNADGTVEVAPLLTPAQEAWLTLKTNSSTDAMASSIRVLCASIETPAQLEELIKDTEQPTHAQYEALSWVRQHATTREWLSAMATQNSGTQESEELTYRVQLGMRYTMRFLNDNESGTTGIYVNSVLPGTPAAEHLQAGDVITAIGEATFENTTSISHVLTTYASALSKARDNNETSWTLTVQRGGKTIICECPLIPKNQTAAKKHLTLHQFDMLADETYLAIWQKWQPTTNHQALDFSNELLEQTPIATPLLLERDDLYLITKLALAIGAQQSQNFTNVLGLSTQRFSNLADNIVDAQPKQFARNPLATPREHTMHQKRPAPVNHAEATVEILINGVAVEAQMMEFAVEIEMADF